VVAKELGLTAMGRVRVAPKPPYSTDFAKIPDGRSPAGWVNTQGKFEVRTLKDGSKALVKLANVANPLVARANAYIGMPTLTDYTIEADVMASQVRGDMSDLGIVANRYTLLLNGNTQQLRIASWDAVPRVDKKMNFKWSPDTWYRMKLTVDVQKGKAVVRGKVWPRSEKEPRAWTMEFEDPTPNREGSPAVYGYATGILDTSPGSECFFANVRLTPNKALHDKAGINK
jgi:outer membrane protein assembly factor BamB